MQQFQKDHPIEVIADVHVVELKNYIETFVAHMDDCNKCTLSFNLRVRPFSAQRVRMARPA